MTSFEYIESSIPAGMTIAEYRRSRPRRASWSRKLLGAARVPALACAAAVLTLGGAATASAGERDPLRSEQWALETLRVPDAWHESKGGGTTIAIVDSGVDLEHPDLRDRLTDGIDLVDGDEKPDDENGHGTHVAGIAAASTSNGTGVAGAAPWAQIMPVRVLDARGSGDDETIAEGIRWAADHGADVINLSLGEKGIAARLSAGGALNAAIQEAADAGVVVVAASGNEGTDHLRSYEVTSPVVIVGAITADETPADFSNFGDLRTVVAPGEGILSTAPAEPTASFPQGTSGYAALDGTSMAAPYVSGVAALLVAQGRDRAEVEQVLFETARGGGEDERMGAGIVDADAATARPVEEGTGESFFDSLFEEQGRAWLLLTGAGVVLLLPLLVKRPNGG